MSLLLDQGLELRHFSEPLPVGGDPATAEWHWRVPYFVMMEWQKSNQSRRVRRRLDLRVARFQMPSGQL